MSVAGAVAGLRPGGGEHRVRSGGRVQRGESELRYLEGKILGSGGQVRLGEESGSARWHMPGVHATWQLGLATLKFLGFQGFNDASLFFRVWGSETFMRPPKIWAARISSSPKRWTLAR